MNRLVWGCVLWLAASGYGRPTERPASVSVEPITAPQILSQVANGSNVLTLVHVWATWCPPCTKEFPSIVKLTKTYSKQGLRVLLVSADAGKDVAAVSEFLVAQGVDWPTYWAKNINNEFIKALSKNWSGAIPASFFFAPDGTLLTDWEGEHSYADYEETVTRLLNEPQKGIP